MPSRPMSSPFTIELKCAERLDDEDALSSFRAEFHIPTMPSGAEQIYLVGNSLGASPKRTGEYVRAELDRWAELGVSGHFRGETAWAAFHELLTEPMARIVGGLAEEVVVMNSLTVNLHLLMVSFYRPTTRRHKILIEEHAFPSDHFAVESQIRQRGFDPDDSLVMVSPRAGEETLRSEDILAAIDEHGSELALVFFPGVQYYTGQVFDIAAITSAAHGVGAYAGFDLAHSVGNVVLDLHSSGADFAAWCTYKYLNSGPGGVAGCFVHQRHISDRQLPKFLGWWGTNKRTRFEMATSFDPIPTAESWLVSNSPILTMVALRASLDIFDEAGGMIPLRQKAELQLGYLDFLLDAVLGARVDCITPASMEERGCQFALRVVSGRDDGRRSGREVFDALGESGVACDWRYPDVIRVAPVPLYTSFVDIHRFVQILDRLTA